MLAIRQLGKAAASRLDSLGLQVTVLDVSFDCPASLINVCWVPKNPCSSAPSSGGRGSGGGGQQSTGRLQQRKASDQRKKDGTVWAAAENSLELT